jgi:P27 family predicted phage terminase small subunit
MPRRPKPTQLKLLEGCKGAAKAAASEPRPRPITDAEPTSPLTERKLELFHGAMAELQPMGHLGVVDVPVLTMWAQFYSLMERALADVHERGAIVAGARGKDRVRNPSVAQARDAATTVRQLATELGMSPAARSGMRVTPRRAQSLEDLLAGRKV